MYQILSLGITQEHSLCTIYIHPQQKDFFNISLFIVLRKCLPKQINKIQILSCFLPTVDFMCGLKCTNAEVCMASYRY